jgi:outer membrane protein OmpA-like peptidoglycan-associated protein
MRGTFGLVFTLAAAMLLAGCQGDFVREAGAEVDEGGFGNPNMNNTLLMTGQASATSALAERFAREVPATITFAFNSSALTAEAQATLRNQATWIRQFPEIRFRVYGHTDLVGSNSYNKALGLRRAKATVAYLGTQGISTSRLEAVASFGKTRPVVQTQGPEERNRRTVTEVTGFVKGSSTLLNGKYAEVIFREYVESATRAIPEGAASATAPVPGG